MPPTLLGRLVPKAIRLNRANELASKLKGAVVAAAAAMTAGAIGLAGGAMAAGATSLGG
jgi:hypothetical protein